MLLLRHVAGYILFRIDDAPCIRKGGAGGSGTGKDARAVDQFLKTTSHLLCCSLSLSSFPGDGETAGG